MFTALCVKSYTGHLLLHAMRLRIAVAKIAASTDGTLGGPPPKKTTPTRLDTGRIIVVRATH